MLYNIYVLLLFCSHTFYVSICEINYVPEEEALQVSWRLFADDLEWAVTPEGDEYFYLGHPNYDSDGILDEYFDQHFYLLIDEERVSPVYIGHEFKGEEVYCYFEIKDYKPNTKTEVFIDAMAELYEDQQHYVHFQNKGKLVNTSLLTKSAPVTQLSL